MKALYSQSFFNHVLHLLTLRERSLLLDATLKAVSEELQVKQASIILLDQQHVEVVGQHFSEIDLQTLRDGIEGWVLREKQPTLTSDILNDIRTTRRALAALSHHPISDPVAVVPCGEKGLITAVGDNLSPVNLHVLAAFGQTLAAALQNLEGLPARNGIYTKSTPLIGMTDSQNLALRTLHHVKANRVSASLGIVAPSGAGKTSFTGWLSAQAKQQQFQVAAVSVSQHDVPYAPWRRLLIQLYPGLESHSENDCREFLTRKHAHWGIRAGLLREILQPAQSSLDAYTIEQKRAAVAALVTDLLVDYGFPVVFVLENVQHIDQSSRFVLESLLSYLALQETQIFLCLTAHTREQLPAQVQQQIHLSMLNQEGVTQFRQQLLGGGSPELDAFLLEKTGGNPLHLRLLMGHIHENNFQWQGLEKTDLRGLVKQVLQHMDERTRYLLYGAAAIPGAFTEAHLAAIDPDLRPDSAIFLSRRDDGRWLFVSSICQEAVAALTPEAERQMIHQRLAAYLEQQHPTYSARIAYHYQQSDQPHLARNYLVQAAHTSHACGAYDEALAYITRALELAGDLSCMEKFVLLTEQADLFYALQEYPKQAAALQKLSEIAREMDDAWLYSESGWRWLNHYRMTRQFAEGIATWKLFYEQAEKAFNTVAKAEISIATALLYQEIGQYEESQNQLDEAVKLAGQTRKMSLGARILFTLGNVLEAAASYDLAQACFEQALEIYNLENNEVGIANCMTALGSMYHNIGHAQVAHNFLEKAYEFWMAVGNFAEAVQCNLILTEIALQQGRPVAAIENAVRVQFVVNQLGNKRLLGRWWLAYGQACYAVGSSSQAIGCFTQALNFIPQPTPEWVEAAVFLTYAYTQTAQPAESQQWLNRLLEVDPDLTNHPYSPLCYLNLAAVLPDRSHQILQAGQQVIRQKAEKIADEKVKKHYLARPDRQSLFNVVAVN